jgi:hypothetical protein
MKEKKNIERLFQEKFKDFEAVPPQDAWINIEARLQTKKKKRRIVPFWFKTSGVAAVLAIVVGLFLNEKVNQKNIPFNQNNENEVVVQDDNKEIDTNNTINPESSSSDFVKEANSIDNKGSIIITTNEIVTANNNSIYTNESERRNATNSNLKKNKLNNKKEVIGNSKKELVYEKSKNEKNQKVQELEKSNWEATDLIPNSSSNLVVEERINSSKDKNNLSSTSDLEEKDNDNILSTNKKNLENDNFIEKLIPENANNQVLVNNSSEKKHNEAIENEILTNQNIAESIIDTLKINEVLAISTEEIKDSIQVVSTDNKEENELEKLLKEKEEGKNADEKEEEKRNKWVVSTNAAPVYFNSISEGSPLDSQFESNDKSYQTSMSYGVGFAYSLSKKLAIRSGVNKVGFSYDTQEVYYSNLLKSEMNSMNLKTLHVDRVAEAKEMHFYKKESVNALSDVENFSSEEIGVLNQQLGYIEVPLELSYKLVDKKFGVDVIGGMSTLFLQDNAVSLKSNGMEMSIGEANNLNDVHFSGNFGFGLRYTFWKSFNANFQPMLKYQFNTFSENSGNFKPYFVGLYTGLSYSF